MGNRSRSYRSQIGWNNEGGGFDMRRRRRCSGVGEVTQDALRFLSLCHDPLLSGNDPLGDYRSNHRMRFMLYYER